VLTTLSRRVMPLLRYRTSDVTRFLDGACDCDLKALRRVAKIVGRCDEMVNCGLGNVSPWVFERLFEGIRGIGHDWQVAVSRPGLVDVVDLRVELLNGASPAAVEESILSALRDQFPDSARNVSMGLCDLKITMHPPGSLRKGRKLRAVVDLRTTLFGTEVSAAPVLAT
jgi:phenylacetate-coenzyme A ligase PaaK-like adenylate-forming protein